MSERAPEPPEVPMSDAGKAERNENSTVNAGKRRIAVSLPLSVRFMAGFGAAVLIGVAVLGNMLLSSLHEFVAHATEPQFIKDTLNYMSFTDGLPAGYKAQMAFRAPDFYIVSAAQNDELRSVVIYWYERQGKIDGKTEIDNFYNLPVFPPDFDPERVATFKSVKEQGRKEIEGGRTAHYLVGTLRDSKSIVYAGAMACLIHKKNVLMVQYLQPADRPFSLDNVFDILRGAKSF